MNGIADLSTLEGYNKLHNSVTVATFRDTSEPVRMEVGLFEVVDGEAFVELFSKDEKDGDVVSVVLNEEKVDELIESLQKAKKLKEGL
ncbi:hypothetical protein JANET_168 [Bacillus phage Janet]|nr:hypothetical protein JANET_168 [Bacillus phage Janet]